MVQVDRFAVLLLAFQALSLLLFSLFTEYSETAATLGAYGIFQNVHVMIFVGFGFLMTFARRYSWSAVGFTYLFAAVSAQWGLLLGGFFHQLYSVTAKGKQFEKISVDVYTMMFAEFCSGAMLISFGGVMGKISHMQMLVVTLMEAVFYSVNELIVVAVFGAVDPGGSMVIHAFGAYFGLALSRVLGNPGKGVKEASTSHKNGLFAMIGTVFLWMYWPSFNAGPVTDDLDRQTAIINTWLSIGASAMAAFTMSIVLRGGKFDMEDVQNATLAGGVAMGASATLRTGLGGALLIGFVAGLVSVCGYVYGSPLLSRIGIDDTCGIHNLHGMPAVFGAIVSAIVCALATEEKYPEGLAKTFPAMGSCSLADLHAHCDRTAGEQAAAQLASLAVSLALALAGGAITGCVVRLGVFQPLKAHECFEDSTAWHVEDGDLAEIEGLCNTVDATVPDPSVVGKPFLNSEGA